MVAAELPLVQGKGANVLLLLARGGYLPSRIKGRSPTRERGASGEKSESVSGVLLV